MEFLFAQNLIVESLDSVPEQFQGLYEEADGKFALRDDPSVKALAAAHDGLFENLNKTKAKLKAANDESAGRRVTTKAIVDYAKELGIEEIDEANPIDSIKAHVASLQTQVKTGKEVRVDMEEVRKKADQRIADADAAAQKRIDSMHGALRKHLVSDQAQKAITAAKGSVDLLLPIVERHAKITHDGDNDDGTPIYSVAIVDDQGTMRMNSTGGNMNVSEFVSDLKLKPGYARAFETESNNGSGAPPNGSRPSQRQRSSVGDEEKTSNEKIAAGLAARFGNRR